MSHAPGDIETRETEVFRILGDLMVGESSHFGSLEIHKLSSKQDGVL